MEVDSLGSDTEKLPVCPGIEAIGKVVAVLPWVGTMTETLAVWPGIETVERLAPLAGTPEEGLPGLPAELETAVGRPKLIP